MRVGLLRRVSKEPSVISGDVDRVVESPHIRLGAHLNRPGFGHKRVTATAMQTPPFDIGHRTRPGVIPKTLDQGAAAGMGLAAKIRGMTGMTGVAGWSCSQRHTSLTMLIRAGGRGLRCG